MQAKTLVITSGNRLRQETDARNTQKFLTQDLAIQLGNAFSVFVFVTSNKETSLLKHYLIFCV